MANVKNPTGKKKVGAKRYLANNWQLYLMLLSALVLNFL